MSGNDVNKITINLLEQLGIFHDWEMELRIKFDYGDKLGFIHVRARYPRKDKKKKAR